jgi:hypothetical protein
VEASGIGPPRRLFGVDSVCIIITADGLTSFLDLSLSPLSLARRGEGEKVGKRKGDKEGGKVAFLLKRRSRCWLWLVSLIGLLLWIPHVKGRGGGGGGGGGRAHKDKGKERGAAGTSRASKSGAASASSKGKPSSSKCSGSLEQADKSLSRKAAAGTTASTMAGRRAMERTAGRRGSSKQASVPHEEEIDAFVERQLEMVIPASVSYLT